MGRLSDVSAILDPYIIEKFGERQVHFYHADNIEQVLLHCKNGRLLTRRDLLNDPETRTAFFSDHLDTRLRVDDRIFGNPYDLGDIFVRGTSNCAPYIYGPIVFEFQPAVYSLMSDIIITPKSIATHGDSFLNHQIREESKVDEIVAYNPWEDTIVKSWQGCELSCDKQVIPLTYLKSISVEPIRVEGFTLDRLVTSLLKLYGVLDRNGNKIPVYERPYRLNNPAPLATIKALGEFCHALPADITEDQWGQRVPAFPENLGPLTDSQVTRFRLWCRYFYFGSVQFVRFFQANKAKS